MNDNVPCSNWIYNFTYTDKYSIQRRIQQRHLLLQTLPDHGFKLSAQNCSRDLESDVVSQLLTEIFLLGSTSVRVPTTDDSSRLYSTIQYNCILILHFFHTTERRWC